MIVLSLFLSCGTGRGPASVPDAASLPEGRGQGNPDKTKNLTDESGCKPLIRQDAYFFGVIASLPHIAYFSELTSPFIVLAFPYALGNDRVGDRRFN